jgi:hypothetical protein
MEEEKMKITTDARTKAVHLILKDIGCIYVEGDTGARIWVSTNYGEIKIGTNTGQVLVLKDGKFEEEDEG